MDGAAGDAIKFGDRKADWIVSMWGTRGKHAHLLTTKLWWSYLGLAIIVLVHANMKDKDDPDVAIVGEPFQARRVDLVDESEAGARILDESTLAGGPKLLAET